VRPKPHRLGTALPATFAVKNWNPHDLYNGSKPGTPPTTLKSGDTITTVGDTSNYTYVYDGIDHYYYLEGPDMTVTIEDGQTMGYMLPTYYVAMPASGQIEVSDSVLASPHAVGLVRRDLRTHRLAGHRRPHLSKGQRPLNALHHGRLLFPYYLWALVKSKNVSTVTMGCDVVLTTDANNNIAAVLYPAGSGSYYVSFVGNTDGEYYGAYDYYTGPTSSSTVIPAATVVPSGMQWVAPVESAH